MHPYFDCETFLATAAAVTITTSVHWAAQGITALPHVRMKADMEITEAALAPRRPATGERLARLHKSDAETKLACKV